MIGALKIFKKNNGKHPLYVAGVLFGLHLLLIIFNTTINQEVDEVYPFYTWALFERRIIRQTQYDLEIYKLNKANFVEPVNLSFILSKYSRNEFSVLKALKVTFREGQFKGELLNKYKSHLLNTVFPSYCSVKFRIIEKLLEIKPAENLSELSLLREQKTPIFEITRDICD